MIHHHINKDDKNRVLKVLKLKEKIYKQLEKEMVHILVKFNLEQVIYKSEYSVELFIMYALKEYTQDNDSMFEIYDNGDYIISNKEIDILNNDKDEFWSKHRIPDIFYNNIINHVGKKNITHIAKVISGLYESDKMFRIIIFDKWGYKDIDEWNYIDKMKN